VKRRCRIGFAMVLPSMGDDVVSLSRPFPIYKQLLSDNSCGPRSILMVADYFEQERGRRLLACEWSRVLEVTMQNDLAGDEGTREDDLIRGLRVAGLKIRKIEAGKGVGDRGTLMRAVRRDHPVVLGCIITHEEKATPHYAVLVGMDRENLFLADPYPHRATPKNPFRVVPWQEFESPRWRKGTTVWGSGRWAVEVWGCRDR